MKRRARRDFGPQLAHLLSETALVRETACDGNWRVGRGRALVHGKPVTYKVMQQVLVQYELPQVVRPGTTIAGTTSALSSL